jgi:hypothetical protein
MAASGTADYGRNVFVNCPFDTQYLPVLHAVLFAIHDCGFLARTALETSGTGETRINRIARLIRECQWAVHDVSRIEMSDASPLPRFNMPFELGLFKGAMLFGRDPGMRKRDYLLLDAQDHQDKRTLSDLAGQDAAYHHNQPLEALASVRRFLAAKAWLRGRAVRGHGQMARRYASFTADLPNAARDARVSYAELMTHPYLPEWLIVAAEWIRRRP